MIGNRKENVSWYDNRNITYHSRAKHDFIIWNMIEYTALEVVLSELNEFEFFLCDRSIFQIFIPMKNYYERVLVYKWQDYEIFNIP